MVKWINYVALEDTVKDIEQNLNTKLPRDFVDVIKKFNKGMPSPNRIPLGNDKFTEFDRLISFNKKESFTVYNSQNEVMKTKKIIPFGTTNKSNFICLKDGSVILYNVENDIEKFISPSFTEFLNLLQ